MKIENLPDNLARFRTEEQQENNRDRLLIEAIRPPRPGQDRRPPGEQKTASGAGLKPVPPSPKPVDRKSGYADQRPVGAPNRPFQEQKKNDYERQKAAKKNAPPIQVRDYGRPPKKSKHKRKKEEVFMPLPDKIVLAENIMVRDLAEKLRRSSAEIVKKLMELGTMATINQVIDYDTAEIVASLYEVKVEREVPEEERILEEIIDDEASLKPRPPVVTVMGHVDHGKTSLLDRIRQADVASGEAGGITQHIGAYQVKVNDNYITFIDTPGHEAFTAMRARGANLTDIVVLVVAADDGVMPQTVEAINHIRAANVPFLVAVNKIDKPNANPDRVMQQLGEHGIVSEDWGGDIIFVPVSAKSGEGIETLLEMILLLAEINDIKSNPDRSAEGVVIEGELDKGRGPVATVLVQKGTLRIGDSLLCGSQICRVRAMTDARGRRVDTAYPSMPVEITGWPEVPEAGGRVRACDEKIAKQIVELRLSEKKLEEQKQSSRVSLDDFFKQMQDSDIKELNLIIKGDVQGSVEALSQSLLRLTTNEVKVNVIHSAVGAITETDVMLASASRAIIIGFNVRPDIKAKKYAEDEGIDVLLYRVIYEAIDDVKKAMVGLLDPEYREKYMGRAEVRALFKVPNVGIVAGCYVVDGKITRNSNVRVLRDGVIIYDGKLASLKRFKDDAKEVLENFECGMGVKDFNDLKEGDFIEAYTMEEIPRQL
ncbi:translation initiation factor IF-2 [Syntrophomonas palmitatica]|uniref:translation initiation factor IF-2 n=1 Tax=Syntrophomonas palmitatica TaxID=402877 RepID=UPI003F707370